MDVASHHIVGEVRLQNNVLGVHVHLEKGNGERQGACQEAAPHLLISGEIDTCDREEDRCRGQSSGNTERRMGNKGQLWSKKASSVSSAGDWKLLQSQGPLQEAPA